MAQEYNILQRFFDVLVLIGYNISSVDVHSTPAEICTQIIRQKPHVLKRTKANSLYYVIDGKKRAFRNLKEHSRGHYGSIKTAVSITIENGLSTPEEEIFIKTGFYKGYDSMFREALLQIMAQCAFEKYNLSWAIPSVIDIMAENDEGMFSMIPKNGCYIYETFLRNNIKKGVPCHQNDVLLFSVISQLGTYVEILTHELQMTHRDMKCSNVLMVNPLPAMETITTKFPDWNIQIKTYLRAILIDFGMSCIPHDSENGKIFTPHKLVWTNDITPRDGRDLFLFFADLWRNEWIRNSITPTAQSLLQSWIGLPWTRELELYKETAWESLFTKIGFLSFDCSRCTPKNVLTDIAKHYSDIVQMNIL
jgi:serine/threonine protein kinase